MKKIEILRGLPGAGKTTYALSRMPEGHIWLASTHGHLVTQPEYHGDLHALRDAHKYCFRIFLGLLNTHSVDDRDDATILVDGTNIGPWEINPYYLAGEAFNWDVKVINFDVENNPRAAWERNTHHCSEVSFRKMLADWRLITLPTHWNVTTISTVEND